MFKYVRIANRITEHEILRAQTNLNSSYVKHKETWNDNKHINKNDLLVNIIYTLPFNINITSYYYYKESYNNAHLWSHVLITYTLNFQTSNWFTQLLEKTKFNITCYDKE